MNIVLAAEESAGLQVLSALAETGHRVVSVLTNLSNQKTGNPNIEALAKSLGLEALPASLLTSCDLVKQFRQAEVDLLLNVHSLYVIHPELLRVPRIGAFNLHPGQLPAYAGLNAPSWAIYNDEPSHGVTLHEMTAGIDTGPIVLEKQFELNDKDTGLTVALRCVQEGVPLVLELLELADQCPEAIPRRQQNLQQRTYYGKQPPQQGRIDWNRPARAVFNFVRACNYGPFSSPWGTPESELDGAATTVTRTALTGLSCTVAAGTVHETQEGRTLVACADEWLELKSFQQAITADTVCRQPGLALETPCCHSSQTMSGNGREICVESAKSDWKNEQKRSSLDIGESRSKQSP